MCRLSWRFIRCWFTEGHLARYHHYHQQTSLSFIPHSIPTLQSSLWCSTRHQLQCYGGSDKSCARQQLCRCVSAALLSSNSGKAGQSWKWTWFQHTWHQHPGIESTQPLYPVRYFDPETQLGMRSFVWVFPLLRDMYPAPEMRKSASMALPVGGSHHLLRNSSECSLLTWHGSTGIVSALSKRKR